MGALGGPGDDEGLVMGRAFGGQCHGELVVGVWEDG